MKTKTVKLKEICEISRCDGSKMPKGTIYLQVSASDKNVRILEEEKELESKFVHIEQKEKRMSQDFFYYCLKRTEDVFYKKFVGTNINIQVDSIGDWEIETTDDKQFQESIVNVIRAIEKTEEKERKQVEEIKNFKKVMLSKLFC